MNPDINSLVYLSPFKNISAYAVYIIINIKAKKPSLLSLIHISISVVSIAKTDSARHASDPSYFFSSRSTTPGSGFLSIAPTIGCGTYNSSRYAASSASSFTSSAPAASSR